VAQKRYKLPSQKPGGGIFYVILALALAGLLGWIWWHSGKTTGTVAVVKTNNVVPPKVVATAPAKSKIVVPVKTAPASGPLSAITPEPAATNAAASANIFPRPVRNSFEAQVALVAQGISPGSIDGAIGSQTRAAILAFQTMKHLPLSGQLDGMTRSNLILEESPYTTYVVTSNDLARLQPLAPTFLGKSQQSALDYETILEMVAEKSFSHPALVKQLNPSVNWSNVTAGTTLTLANAAYPDPPKAAWVTIRLNEKLLEAFDAETNLIAHFPCSIAKRVEKRPVGELHVAVVAPNPNYTFDPEVFPELPEAQELKRKLILPPGPNNPVGVAWIGLDKPGYGIHGTPQPENVGRTESHGCFRLANWNADYLLKMVTIGTPVYVKE
jgi:lipoprotein-anchoring transpeptidase ErfK/SrfK